MSVCQCVHLPVGLSVFFDTSSPFFCNFTIYFFFFSELVRREKSVLLSIFSRFLRPIYINQENFSQIVLLLIKMQIIHINLVLLFFLPNASIIGCNRNFEQH